MKVLKRDGTIQEFVMTKPLHALERVYTNGLKSEFPESIKEKFMESMETYVYEHKEQTISIEEIQDFIRDFLIKNEQNDAAESFIIYRNKRSEYRESNTLLAKNINTKLYAKNVVNQNANLDENSFSGRIHEAGSEVCKDNALKHRMSKMARKNHEENMIYQHDLDSFSVGLHNCLSEPVDPLLAHGFKVKQCDIRPASSISTAMQLIAVIFQLQSLEQFGGVSATHLDWTMVPYFRISFYKHFMDGLEYVERFGIFKSKSKVIKSYKSLKNKVKSISIEDPLYKKYKKTYNYALNKTLNELAQSVEALIHNLNSLQSRGGGQLPFSSINYGTCTLPEGRAVTKAILEGTIAGTGKYHKTAIFPCGIFQYDEKIHGTKDNPGPNYDLFRLALSSTAKRIYPNYCNCQWSTNLKGNKVDRRVKYKALTMLTDHEYAKLYGWLKSHPDYQDYLSLDIDDYGKITTKPAEQFTRYEVMGTMGCRTYNGYDINADENYFAKLFKHIANDMPEHLEDNWLLSANQKDGRGNICPVTIILPKLAMMAKAKSEKSGKSIIDEFISILKKKIQEAHDMLIERFTLICSQSPKSAAFMYGNNTMVGYVPEEGISSALKHGTLVIGQLGLAEALQIMVGCDQTHQEGMDLAKKIESIFNMMCADYKKNEKINFGVYYTPAESLCYTAMKKFKGEYGEIPNVSDHEFFTNSIHVPVYDDVDAFKKIDIESQLTGYSNAGCITYVEVDTNVETNIDAMEQLVVYAMQHDIPYFAINRKINTCRDCGYSGSDVDDVCPVCGSHNVEHLARVTGYLSTSVENMNYGKQNEVKERKKHVSKRISFC